MARFGKTMKRKGGRKRKANTVDAKGSEETRDLGPSKWCSKTAMLK